MGNIESVLRKIEKMEKSWRYELTDEQDKQHSFGRVPEDGKEIKFWSVPRSTGEFLRFLVLATESKTVLELGCSAGYSTIWIASAIREIGGHIYTTEILKNKTKLAKENFREAGVEDCITLLEKDIVDVLSDWKEKTDFVFMDADKDKYDTYYDMIFPLLKSGGIIVADNAVNYCHLMKPFLEKVKSDKRIVSQLIDFDNGLMLIYKK